MSSLLLTLELFERFAFLNLYATRFAVISITSFCTFCFVNIYFISPNKHLFKASASTKSIVVHIPNFFEITCIGRYIYTQFWKPFDDVFWKKVVSKIHLFNKLKNISRSLQKYRSLVSIYILYLYLYDFRIGILF